MRSVFIPSRKIVYICNPKVAGSSIIQTLLQIDTSLPAWVLKDHNDQKARKRISGIRDPKRFWESLTDGEAFRFAFVRNPYARLLSCYRDKIQSQREPRFLLSIGIKDGSIPSFLEFLQIISKQNPAQMNRHWMPQARLIPEQIKLSMLGRFENLESDLSLLGKNLGLTDVPLKRVDPHRTDTGNSFELKPSEIDLMNRSYSEDFRRFNYEKL